MIESNNVSTTVLYILNCQFASEFPLQEFDCTKEESIIGVQLPWQISSVEKLGFGREEREL